MFLSNMIGNSKCILKNIHFITSSSCYITVLLFGHDFDKLIVVDFSVLVGVSLPDHVLNFFIAKLLSQVGQSLFQLRPRDVPVAVLVENAKGVLQLRLVTLRVKIMT